MPGPTPPDAARFPIYCDRLARRYPDGDVSALGGVTLGFAKGEYSAIMGPSGCGKSTLLNLLAGLDRPDEGEVYFDGVPLADAGLMKRLRSRVLGMVFQAFHLIPTLTASENVQIPMFETTPAATARAARAADLLGLVGLGNRVGHKPTQLSGGERQRVAVARALANDAPILLADEPTGNLDSASGTGVLDLFDRLHRERNLTLLVVTHSPEVSDRAGRVIRMRDGRVVEDTRKP